MLVAEAGAGTRRSRGEVGDFRVLRVAGGPLSGVHQEVRCSGGQRGRAGLFGLYGSPEQAGRASGNGRELGAGEP